MSCTAGATLSHEFINFVPVGSLSEHSDMAELQRQFERRASQKEDADSITITISFLWTESASALKK